MEKKEYTRPKDILTVAEACEIYLGRKKNDAKKDGGARADSTLDLHDNIINKHIIPALGDYKLNEVDNGLAEKTKETWRETLGDSLNKVLMVIRSLYEENDNVKNPFKRVKNAPRKDGRKQDELSEVDSEKVYSSADVGVLLAHSLGDRDRLMLRLTAEAGLRDGENLGLSIEHVLPEKRLIEVRYQWRCRKNDYDKNGMPILSKKLKTPQSRREIKISTTLAVELAKWKLDHAKNPYAVTTDGKKVQLMFVNSVNRPCSRKDLSKAMSKAIANAHEAGHNLKILDSTACAITMLQF